MTLTPLAATLWAVGDIVSAACLLLLADLTRRGGAVRPDMVPPVVVVTWGGMLALMGLGLGLDALALVAPAVWGVRVAWGLLLASWAVATVVVTLHRRYADDLPERSERPAVDPLAHDPTYVSPRRLRRLLADAPVGVCVVSTEGVITHIEGGALREVGTTPAQWLGLHVDEPWHSRGFLPAMQGEVVAFVGLDPVLGERDQLIIYAPHYDGAGEIDGASCFWGVLPPGSRIEISEDSDHGRRHE